MRVTRLRHTRAAATTLIMVVTLVPFNASGQSITSPYQFLEGTHTLGVIVGTLEEKRGELGIGPGGGTLIGGRYGLELRGPLALDVQGFAVSTDRKVFAPVEGTGLVEIGKTDMNLVGLDARLRFTVTGRRTWNRIAPFIALGGGVVSDLSGPSSIEADLESAERVSFGPSFLGVLGGGIRIVPTDRLELRTEADLRIWKLGTPVGFRDVEPDLAGPLPDQEWIGPGAVLLGATYRF